MPPLWQLISEYQYLFSNPRKHAERLLHARNEAHRQPLLNLQIARAYMLAGDPAMVTRNWQVVMDKMIQTKSGPTRYRWIMACKDAAFDTLRALKLIDTRAEHFIDVLKEGTVSTNVYLRRLHNFALDTNWLLLPALAKNQWPRPRYRPKRGITLEEHERIVRREMNPEKQAYYKLIWHLGASQGDLVNLSAEDVDWQNRIISFERLKTRWRGQQPCVFSFGLEVAKILMGLPQTGLLFPHLKTQRASDRATHFKKRCRTAGVDGVTLHCYRYAWAERAKKSGYPERFAMQALGHNSAAVHRAYAKGARVTMPPLEDYEADSQASGKIIPFSGVNSPAASKNGG
jgi:integrase